MDSQAKRKILGELAGMLENDSLSFDDSQVLAVLDSFNSNEWGSMVNDFLSRQDYLNCLVGFCEPDEVPARLINLFSRCSPKSILQLSRVLLTALHLNSEETEDLLTILSGIVDYVDYRDVRSFTCTEGVDDEVKERVSLMLTGRTDIPHQFWLDHPEVSKSWFLSTRIAVAYNDGPEAMLYALKDYDESVLSKRPDVQNALKLAVRSMLIRFDGFNVLDRVLDSLPDPIVKYILGQIKQGDFPEFIAYITNKEQAKTEFQDNKFGDVYSIQGEIIDSIRNGVTGDSFEKLLSDLAAEIRFLLERNEAEYKRVLEAISGSVSCFAETSFGGDINRAFLASLEESGCPIKDLSLVQYKYYKNLYLHHSPTSKSQDELDRWVQGYLSGLTSAHYPTPDHFSICAMPYAEGAYLYLFSEFCKQYFHGNVKINLVEDVGWSDVGHKLSNGDISLAISNPDAIANAIDIENSKNSVGIVETKDSPCYMMDTFDVLVRVDHLKNVNKEVSSPELKGKIEQIIQGESLRKLSEVSEDNKELLKVIFGSDQCKVSTLGYSVLSKAVTKLKGKYDIEFFVEFSESTRGLVDLLEGRVEFYVGGTIHSYYAQEAFKNRVVCLGSVQEMVPGILYLNETISRECPKFSKILQELWSRFTHAWHNLISSSDADYANIKSMILSYVNVELSKPNHFCEDEGLSLAKVSTFPSLVHMLNRSKLIFYNNRSMKPWKNITEKELLEERRNMTVIDTRSASG